MKDFIEINISGENLNLDHKDLGRIDLGEFIDLYRRRLLMQLILGHVYVADDILTKKYKLAFLVIKETNAYLKYMKEHTHEAGGYLGNGAIDLVAILLGNSALSPFLRRSLLFSRDFALIIRAACILASFEAEGYRGQKTQPDTGSITNLSTHFRNNSVPFIHLTHTRYI